MPDGPSVVAATVEHRRYSGGVPPPSPPLAGDEVDVWLARPDAAARDRDRAVLSADERAAADRFHFERDRDLYTTAHALLRRALTHHGGRDTAAWDFERNAYGCPRIAGGSPLRFNLSHTPGLVAVAIAVDREVGVDVEHVARPGATVELADDFFAPAEVRALRALPAAEQRERFFAYWTLKESYIKARGMGLSIPLAQFAFDLSDPAGIRIAFTAPLVDDPAAWYFERSQPTPEHAMAITVARRGVDTPRVRVTTIESAGTS
jgi:4'-phosphopantetheinyl transferase